MSKTYTITLTEDQARVVRVACEVMARVSCGQYEALMEVRGVAELDTECQGRVMTLLHELQLEWFREHHGSTGTALAGQEGRTAWLVYRVLRDALDGRPLTMNSVGLADAGPMPTVEVKEAAS